ncbi:uncharacterized protein N0V89_009040 [Didymosphaeria variabile]|uniref:Calcium-dependent phosphotriesterase n=1 Tax=Didymosphaeria variabile TaxID=1932322 RepID=A0A9W9C964_9PLEO|nr:uncharacterized protein N0V89_009040 [Didymosphaeria variabile]KAJ4350419.1 hypothetical protein N0V89_009040 [Didymosphaeria variabile]
MNDIRSPNLDAEIKTVLRSESTRGIVRNCLQYDRPASPSTQSRAFTMRATRCLSSVITYALFTSVAFARRKVTSEALYQFDEPTWIENFAVRANGLVLPARATSAILTELNLADGNLRTIANESSFGNAIMGITQVAPDFFAMNTMYCDLTILSVNLREDVPIIKKIAEGPSSTSVLNGMAALNSETVLIVDQALGGIWAISLSNRSPSALIIKDESMLDPNNTANGVNGIRVRPGILYFNNPALGTFARMPIDPESGVKTGDAKVIASGQEPDDFEIDERRGVAYLTNGPADTLLEVDLETGRYEVVLGGLPGPTTVRWANGHGALHGAMYVATTGGYPQWLDGNPTVGGAIYRVLVDDCIDGQCDGAMRAKEIGEREGLRLVAGRSTPSEQGDFKMVDEGQEQKGVRKYDDNDEFVEDGELVENKWRAREL